MTQPILPAGHADCLPPLHVVVLAAGVGSRLPGSADRPKWLTPVAGRTIATEQLAGIGALRDRWDLHLDVLTGHAAHLVEDLVADLPGTSTVHNPRYAELNNWYSVLLALQHRQAASRRGPLVLLNSDLWAPAAWFTAAVDALARSATPALVVDTRRALTDEAMKVAATGGRACAIGKVGVEQPVGEYTGALSLPADDVPVLVKALTSFVDDPDRVSAWYEHGVDVTFGMGLEWALVEAPTEWWVEVDDAADLHRASALAVGGP